MLNFHNDDNIKILYDRVVNADYQELEAIGATDSLTLRELGFTPDDTNSIFVSKTGDDGNPGTESEPVLTIEQAITLCTSAKENIIINDSETYNTVSFKIEGNFKNLYANIGCSPTVNLELNSSDPDFFSGGIDLLEVDFTSEKSGMCSAILQNNNIVHFYRSGSPANYYFIITNQANSIIAGPVTVAISGGAPSNNLINQQNDIAVLNNGDFVIVYAQSAVQYVKQYDYRGNHKYTYNMGSTDNYKNGRIAALDTDDSRFVTTSFWSDVHRYTVARGSNGTMVKNQSSIGTTSTSPWFIGHVFITPLKKGLNQGRFIISSRSTAGDNLGRAKIYDKNGTVVYTSPDTPYGDLYHHIELKDGRILGMNKSFTFDTEYTGFTFKIYNSDFTVNTDTQTKFSFNLTDYGATSLFKWERLTGDYIYDDKFLLIAGNCEVIYTSSQKYKQIYFLVDAETFEQAMSPDFTEPASNDVNENNTYVEINNDFIYRWYYTYLAYKFKKIGYFTYKGIISENNFKLNGIKLTSNEEVIDSLVYIQSPSTGSIKWCEINNTNFIKITVSYDVQPIVKGDLTELKNSKLLGNTSGVDIQQNDVEVYRCQFVGLGKAPAIKITGIGSSIINCDFVYCSEGIKLKDNDGTEIIKNCSFYKNIKSDIDAETEVELNYSLYTGVLVNCTLGTRVLQVNPLYINDGFNDITQINLNLKRKLLGYLADSAGIGLADDGGDAGSHKTVILNVEETWQSIRLPKGEMKRKFGPAWAVSNIFDSGRMKSQKKGMVETIEIDWSKGLKAEHVDKIIKLNSCDSSEVRLYPDPVTHPLDYGTFTFEYQEIDLDPGTNRLSDRGYRGVKMIFKRSYEDLVL